MAFVSCRAAVIQSVLFWTGNPGGSDQFVSLSDLLRLKTGRTKSTSFRRETAMISVKMLIIKLCLKNPLHPPVDNKDGAAEKPWISSSEDLSDCSACQADADCGRYITLNIDLNNVTQHLLSLNISTTGSALSDPVWSLQRLRWAHVPRDGGTEDGRGAPGVPERLRDAEVVPELRPAQCEDPGGRTGGGEERGNLP